MAYQPVRSQYHPISYEAKPVDLIQSIGWILTLYHVERGFVAAGVACSVQGIFINSGDISSALWSLVIAVHTFLLLGIPKWEKWAKKISVSGYGRWVLCFFIWLLVLFIGLIGFVIEKRDSEDGPFCTLIALCATNSRHVD